MSERRKHTLCIDPTFGSVRSSKESGSYCSRKALAWSWALWYARAMYHEVSPMWPASPMGNPMKSKRLPGLGYESGGYAPFLTTNLSIHPRADAFRSSEAVRGTEMSLIWYSNGKFTGNRRYLGRPPRSEPFECRLRKGEGWDETRRGQPNLFHLYAPPASTTRLDHTCHSD